MLTTRLLIAAGLSILPIVPLEEDTPVRWHTVDAVRGLSARFQRDVVLLLETGVKEEERLNSFSLRLLC